MAGYDQLQSLHGTIKSADTSLLNNNTMLSDNKSTIIINTISSQDDSIEMKEKKMKEN